MMDEEGETTNETATETASAPTQPGTAAAPTTPETAAAPTTPSNNNTNSQSYTNTEQFIEPAEAPTATPTANQPASTAGTQTPGANHPATTTGTQAPSAGSAPTNAAAAEHVATSTGTEPPGAEYLDNGRYTVRVNLPPPADSMPKASINDNDTDSNTTPESATSFQQTAEPSQEMFVDTGDFTVKVTDDSADATSQKNKINAARNTTHRNEFYDNGLYTQRAPFKAETHNVSLAFEMCGGSPGPNKVAPDNRVIVKSCIHSAFAKSIRKTTHTASLKRQIPTGSGNPTPKRKPASDLTATKRSQTLTNYTEAEEEAYVDSIDSDEFLPGAVTNYMPSKGDPLPPEYIPVAKIVPLTPVAKVVPLTSSENSPMNITVENHKNIKSQGFQSTSKRGETLPGRKKDDDYYTFMLNNLNSDPAKGDSEKKNADSIIDDLDSRSVSGSTEFKSRSDYTDFRPRSDYADSKSRSGYSNSKSRSGYANSKSRSGYFRSRSDYADSKSRPGYANSKARSSFMGKRYESGSKDSGSQAYKADFVSNHDITNSKFSDPLSSRTIEPMDLHSANVVKNIDKDDDGRYEDKDYRYDSDTNEDTMNPGSSIAYNKVEKDEEIGSKSRLLNSDATSNPKNLIESSNSYITNEDEYYKEKAKTKQMVSRFLTEKLEGADFTQREKSSQHRTRNNNRNGAMTNNFHKKIENNVYIHERRKPHSLNIEIGEKDDVEGSHDENDRSSRPSANNRQAQGHNAPSSTDQSPCARAVQHMSEPFDCVDVNSAIDNEISSNVFTLGLPAHKQYKTLASNNNDYEIPLLLKETQKLDYQRLKNLSDISNNVATPEPEESASKENHRSRGEEYEDGRGKDKANDEAEYLSESLPASIKQYELGENHYNHDTPESVTHDVPTSVNIPSEEEPDYPSKTFTSNKHYTSGYDKEYQNGLDSPHAESDKDLPDLPLENDTTLSSVIKQFKIKETGFNPAASYSSQSNADLETPADDDAEAFSGKVYGPAEAHGEYDGVKDDQYDSHSIPVIVKATEQVDLKRLKDDYYAGRLNRTSSESVSHRYNNKNNKINHHNNNKNNNNLNSKNNVLNNTRNKDSGDKRISVSATFHEKNEKGKSEGNHILINVNKYEREKQASGKAHLKGDMTVSKETKKKKQPKPQTHQLLKKGKHKSRIAYYKDMSNSDRNRTNDTEVKTGSAKNTISCLDNKLWEKITSGCSGAKVLEDYRCLDDVLIDSGNKGRETIHDIKVFDEKLKKKIFETGTNGKLKKTKVNDEDAYALICHGDIEKVIVDRDKKLFVKYARGSDKIPRGGNESENKNLKVPEMKESTGKRVDIVQYSKLRWKSRANRPSRRLRIYDDIE